MTAAEIELAELTRRMADDEHERTPRNFRRRDALEARLRGAPPEDAPRQPERPPAPSCGVCGKRTAIATRACSGACWDIARERGDIPRREDTPPPEELVVVTKGGKVLVVGVASIAKGERDGTGERVMGTVKGDHIVAVAPVPPPNPQPREEAS